MFPHGIIQGLLKSPKFPGRDFLIEQLPKWFLKKPNAEQIVSTRFGFDIYVSPHLDPTIDNVVYERGVYEYGTLNIIREWLKPGDSFIDVGANIGLMSLAAAATVLGQGKIHAFEPFPSTMGILERNKTLNKFDQIEIHPYALAAKNEKVIIYPEKGNRGGASIINHQNESGVEIETKMLDDFNFPSIDLIKIDVEGFELEVLKGAEESILRSRPKLIVEVSNERSNSGSAEEIFNWLNQLDIYHFYKLKKGKERPSSLIEIFSVTDLPNHDNLFLIPKN